MNDLMDLVRAVPRIAWLGLIAAVGLLIWLAYLLGPTTSTTIHVSEKGSSMTVGGKTYDIEGDSKTIKLKPATYTLTVFKSGFETDESELVIPSEQASKLVIIKLRPVVSDELTAALPKSINQAGLVFKAARVTYYIDRTWAVAEVVQFKDTSTDLDNLYAVFKLVDGKWQVVLGPASEFEDSDLRSGLPTSVLENLNKRLTQ